MKLIIEDPIEDFYFGEKAAENAKWLDDDDWYDVEEWFDDTYNGDITEQEVKEIFAERFDMIANALGFDSVEDLKENRERRK